MQFFFDEFNEIMKLMDKNLPIHVIREIWNHTENFAGERGVFLATYHFMKQERYEFSPDAIFHLQFAIYQNKCEMKVVKIEN